MIDVYSEFRSGFFPLTLLSYRWPSVRRQVADVPVGLWHLCGSLVSVGRVGYQPRNSLLGLAWASLLPHPPPATGSPSGCWPVPQWFLRPSVLWVFPLLLDFFPYEFFLTYILAQLRVKDFCPFKFSSRERNPRKAGRKGGGVGSLLRGVIVGKADGLKSWRDNSFLHTSMIAVTGLFYNSLFTCLSPPQAHKTSPPSSARGPFSPHLCAPAWELGLRASVSAMESLRGLASRACHLRLALAVPEPRPQTTVLPLTSFF